MQEQMLVSENGVIKLVSNSGSIQAKKLKSMQDLKEQQKFLEY